MNTGFRNLLVGISVVGAAGGYLMDRAGNLESESWTEYESDRYTITFPTSETPDGLPGEEMTGMMVLWRDQGYSAGWMPESKENRGVDDASYLEGLTQVMESAASVKSSRMHTYEGMTAFDFELASKKDNSGQFARVLRKDDRLYSIWVRAFDGQALDPSAPEIQTFLASFHAR